jgi:tetratricopeptide (TPR) repeat protein
MPLLESLKKSDGNQAEPNFLQISLGDVGASRLMTEECIRLANSGALKEAEARLQILVTIMAHFQGSTLQYARALTALGDILDREAVAPGKATKIERQKQLHEAEVDIRRALDIDNFVCGPNSVTLTGPLLMLSNVLIDEGKYHDAEFFVSRGITINSQAVGSDNVRVADFYNVSGRLWEVQKNYEKAAGFYKRAYEAYIKVAPNYLPARQMQEKLMHLKSIKGS